MWDDTSLLKPSIKAAKMDPLRWEKKSPAELVKSLSLKAMMPGKHAGSGVFVRGKGQPERRFDGPKEAAAWIKYNLEHHSCEVQSEPAAELKLQSVASQEEPGWMDLEPESMRPPDGIGPPEPEPEPELELSRATEAADSFEAVRAALKKQLLSPYASLSSAEALDGDVLDASARDIIRTLSRDSGTVMKPEAYSRAIAGFDPEELMEVYSAAATKLGKSGGAKAVAPEEPSPQPEPVEPEPECRISVHSSDWGDSPRLDQPASPQPQPELEPTPEEGLPPASATATPLAPAPAPEGIPPEPAPAPEPELQLAPQPQPQPQPSPQPSPQPQPSPEPQPQPQHRITVTDADWD